MTASSRHSRRPTALVSLALVATLVAGCAPTVDGDTTEPAGSAQKGGTLRVGLSDGVGCVDPVQSVINTVWFVSRNFVDTLTDQDPTTGEIVPWLAESWDIEDEGATFVFHLRDDVTFSDGSALTADVVKANFDLIAELGPAKTSLAGTVTSGYIGSEALDEHTVEIRFDAPNAQFLQATSTVALGIFSQTTVDTPVEERCQGDLIASGPFTIDAFSSDNGVTLVRRDDYDWGPNIRQHEGAAYLDAIDFQVTPDAGVRSGRLQSGEIHFDTVPLTETISTFEGNGFQVLARVYPGVGESYTVNVSRPYTADENVRQALNLGIDRDALVSGALSSYDQPATSLLTTATPLYEAVDGIEYDPETATELLEASGWTLGDDGIRQKDGERLTLLAVFQLADRQSQAVNEVIQSQLKEIGIDLQIRSYGPAELASTREEGNYDLWYTPWIRPDADVLRSLFWYGGSNAAKVTQERPVDELLVLQRTQVDDGERQATLTAAVEGLVEGGYGIALFDLAGIYTASDKVRGNVFEASSRLNFFDTWLSE